MSTITRILDNQEVNFDSHSRGTEIDLNYLHFHKRQNGNNKKYGKASIIFYLNGECKCETDCLALEKEVNDVLHSMSVTEKIEFVHEMGQAVDKYFKNNGLLTNEKMLEIRENIVKAFFPDELNVIRSKPFKKMFGTSYSEIETRINGKKYRISLTSSGQEKKKIIIKDITNNRNQRNY